MKKIKSVVMIAAIVVASGLVVMSCKKNKDVTPADTDTEGAKDNSMAENASSDIISIGSQASDNSTGGLSSYRMGEADQVLSSCATVTRDTIAHIVTVTFNNSTCLDGRTRNGVLTFDYSASTGGARHYRDPGFSCTVTSNGYVVDGNQINIVSKTISNTTPVGFDPAVTNETWHIVANINVVKANGNTISWSCDRTKTLLNTSTTYTNAQTPINWQMARVGITGTASGTRGNGETFTVTVTSQLIRDFGSCSIAGKHPFIQGTLDYAPSNKPVRHFDFGSGTCDLNATVTINNVTYTIVLP